MQTTYDKLADIPSMVDSWADAVSEGRLSRAHELVLRLTTLPRFRGAGLDALVARCTACGGSSELTAALLRQLSCSAANGRGGLHARKYAVTVGLNLSWFDRDAFNGLAWAVYGYWFEALKRRRLTVGARGDAAAGDLLTHARFQVDRQMAPVVPGLAPRYAEWLEERNVTGDVDDTLCWMLDCAHMQTLWVTAQASDAVRQSVLSGKPTPLFLESVAQQVRQAWKEAVERFLSLWVTDDPEKVSKPLYERPRTPWISRDTGQQAYPELLATLAVSAPLEPFAAWQRQQTYAFLHGLVDGVFYNGRTTGVLGLFEAGDRLFGLTWSTTPQPRMDEYASELSAVQAQAESGTESVLPPLPRDTLDALWHAAQHYWDCQGEPLAGALGVSGGTVLAAERSHGWLPVPCGEQSREWVLGWASAMPRTVRVWCPPALDAVAPAFVPLPPAQLLQSAPEGAHPVSNDLPVARVPLEEAVFGPCGRELVTTVDYWEPGFAKRAQRGLARHRLARDCSLDVAVEQGVPQWLTDAFTPRGRELLGEWLRQNSPVALCRPFEYAQRLACLPEADAAAVAEWLRSSVLYEMYNENFVWTVAVLLNAEHVRRFRVGADLLAHLQQHQAPRDSLSVQDVLTVGTWAVVEFDEDAQPVSPASPVPSSQPPAHTFFRSIQLWWQAQSNGEVRLAVATHERTIVQVCAGDRTSNSVLLGNGQRQRWVDWHYQELLPAVTPQTRLVDFWSEIEKKSGRGPAGRIRAAVEHLAQLGHLMAGGGLTMSTSDLTLFPLAPAATLDDVFRRPQGGLSPNAFAGVVLPGWRLQAATVPGSAPEAHGTTQLGRQGEPELAVPAVAGQGPAKASSRKETLRLSLQERLHLGQLLRQARQTLGLTAKDVAHDVFGLPAAHASVARIERGCLETLAIARLTKLLTFYGLELDQVLTASRAGAVAWGQRAPKVGARVKSVREALGLTPAEFAAWVAAPGLTAMDVARMESGQDAPHTEVVDRILRLQPSLSRRWLLANEAGDVHDAPPAKSLAEGCREAHSS